MTAAPDKPKRSRPCRGSMGRSGVGCKKAGLPPRSPSMSGAPRTASGHLQDYWRQLRIDFFWLLADLEGLQIRAGELIQCRLELSPLPVLVAIDDAANARV